MGTYCNGMKIPETYGEGFKYLRENFDKEGISLWRAKYNYNEENKVEFMTNNAIGGAYTRLDGPRKKLFGMGIVIHNKEKTYYEIEFLWLCGGTVPIFTLDEDWNTDMDYYTLPSLISTMLMMRNILSLL